MSKDRFSQRSRRIAWERGFVMGQCAVCAALLRAPAFNPSYVVDILNAMALAPAELANMGVQRQDLEVISSHWDAKEMRFA